MKFEDWFNTKFNVSNVDITNHLHSTDIVINVSDEYSLDHHRACKSRAIDYFWFPLVEKHQNSANILAALQILKDAEKKNRKVLIHCRSGRNRSVSIKQAYYYYRTGDFIKESINKQDRLNENMCNGTFPPIRKFLTMIRTFKRTGDIQKAILTARI